jgi:DNA-directed RNA polymerase beta' subunit
MLDADVRDIERVLYFESYVVLDAGMTDLERGQLLTDEQYLDTMEKWGDEFVAKMGAEAIHELLRGIDLNQEVARLREEIGATRSVKPSACRSASSCSSRSSIGQAEWIATVAGAAAGPASAGAAGRWPLRDLRPQRPVPPRHQPQQPPQAAAGARRA